MAGVEQEYSATRDHERADVDALLLHYYQEAARILEVGPHALLRRVSHACRGCAWRRCMQETTT